MLSRIQCCDGRATCFYFAALSERRAFFRNALESRAEVHFCPVHRSRLYSIEDQVAASQSNSSPTLQCSRFAWIVNSSIDTACSNVSSACSLIATSDSDPWKAASPLPLTVEAETQSRTLPCWSVASEHDRWHVSRKGKGRSVTGKNKRKSRLKGANKPQYHALSGYGRQGSPQGINRTVLRAKEFAVLLPQNLVVEASVPLGARLCDSRFLAHLLAIDGAFTIIGEWTVVVGNSIHRLVTVSLMQNEDGNWERGPFSTGPNFLGIRVETALSLDPRVRLSMPRLFSHNLTSSSRCSLEARKTLAPLFLALFLHAALPCRRRRTRRIDAPLSTV